MGASFSCILQIYGMEIKGSLFLHLNIFIREHKLIQYICWIAFQCASLVFGSAALAQHFYLLCVNSSSEQLSWPRTDWPCSLAANQLWPCFPVTLAVHLPADQAWNNHWVPNFGKLGILLSHCAGRPVWLLALIREEAINQTSSIFSEEGRWMERRWDRLIISMKKEQKKRKRWKSEKNRNRWSGRTTLS